MFARLFAVESPEVTLEKFFEGVALKSSTAIRLGPSIAEMLLARQREHVVGIETLTQSLKVMILVLVPIHSSLLKIVRLHVAFYWQPYECTSS